MEQYANNANTTLSAAITSTSSTTLTVTSATGFPASGTFRIMIDLEILKVTGVSGTTFTVARGDGGTTAATHSNAAPVVLIVTNESLNALVSIESAGTEISTRRVLNFVSGATVADNSGSSRCDITIGAGGNVIGYGAGASKPAFGTAGNLYIPSDGVITSLDTGSAWVGWCPGNAIMTIPPVVSGWTTINPTYVVATDVAGGGIQLVQQANNSTLGGIKRSISNGISYTIIAAIKTCFSGSAGRAGVFVTDGTKYLSISAMSGYNVTVGEWTNATTYAADLVNINPTPLFGGNYLWIKVTNDGTHRTFYLSADGFLWFQMYQMAYNTYISSDASAGVYAYAGANSVIPDFLLLGWSGA